MVYMEKFFYRAQTGDSVLTLSRKFSIPLCCLINDNNLKNEITQGDLLFINRQNFAFYTVKPLETADNIAKKFNISKEKLLKDNAVDYVFYGLILKIEIND